jgi:hypothetical protein
VFVAGEPLTGTLLAPGILVALALADATERPTDTLQLVRILDPIGRGIAPGEYAIQVRGVLAALFRGGHD